MKNIVITGAGGVLCSAFAKALAADGNKIALLDLNVEAAQKVADEIGEGSGREIHRTTPSFIALRSAGSSVRKRLASAHPFLPFCF